ncbi:hypothetical protein EQG49_07695 [Periweissella cryptocerci]|uniref:Uncharacterized protein n=1 Tax=Periweissella cryptocerci TaxID=2506420 RepID=A0A4P6YUF6_9LACO|nr:hypothetical protein [Periweissella cryptocerci]QBO36351.1 hypothetical protein EQG49_07695 [Periweissella cryptocerci]
MPKIVKTIMLVIIALTVSGKTTAIIPATHADAAAKVWIAPKHGKKYHKKKNCRGLNNARSKKRITLKKAKQSGFTLCGWEKSRAYKRVLSVNKQGIIERQATFVMVPLQRALPVGK